MRAAVVLLAAALVSSAADAGSADALRASLEVHGTRAVLIVRDGKTALEWYAPGVGPETRQGTASLAKALVGGMSLLVALEDGRLRADDPAHRFIPAWRDHPRKSRITIRHLATHSSGIEDAELDHIPHEKLPGWKGAFWRRDPDPFSIALHDAPVIFEPGTRYAYSNTGMAALAYAVTASLRGAPQSDIRELLHERVMRPLAIPDEEWSIGYGRAYEVDGLKLYANWGGGAFTPRAAARIGQLMMQGGAWNGRALLAADWVRRVLSPAGTPAPPRLEGEPQPLSGLAWYTNADGIWPGVPRDAFAGGGAGHQLLLVVPSLKLIAVRNGRSLSPNEPFWTGALKYFLQPAVAAAAAYPRSPVIRRVTFAPRETIVRQAIDSDNFPITWGADDSLYTAYGDGTGFDPKLDHKVSLGYARISGPPESFRAENIRSESGERLGNGKAGAKASGMLMAGGVLYMWVRNVGNSQLWWSEDRARTWQTGFKFETSFGSPAFLNYGRDHAGARDDYVYTYSQDGPSAYEVYDHAVLARAREDRIRDRAAWQFFAGLDASGKPRWSQDIKARQPVFTLPGRCQRVDAVYNPRLKRYLLAVGYDHSSRWGIYDAPEPWGPWTAAFTTDRWDEEGTHGYRMPAKWISRDGRTMWLVFSGTKQRDPANDAFCVRRMTIETAP